MSQSCWVVLTEHKYGNGGNDSLQVESRPIGVQLVEMRPGLPLLTSAECGLVVRGMFKTRDEARMMFDSINTVDWDLWLTAWEEWIRT